MTFRPTLLPSVNHQPNSRLVHPATYSTSPLSHFTNISSIVCPSLKLLPFPQTCSVPLHHHQNSTGCRQNHCYSSLSSGPHGHCITKSLGSSSKLRRCPLASPSLHKPSASRLDLHLLLATQPPSLIPTHPSQHSSQNGLTAQVRLGPLEKEMATHSSTIAWKVPLMEEPGRL